MKNTLIKKTAFVFLATSLLGPAAHAASAVAGAVVGMAIVGATLVGAAALDRPIHDTLRKQAFDFSSGVDQVPGKELTEVFVRIRKNPGYERYNDRQLSEEVLAALDADPIQN